MKLMRFLRGLLWCAVAVALIAIAMYVTSNFELADRLTELFLTLQPWLPITFNVDHFLVVLTVLSVLIVVLVISGSAALMVIMAGRLSLARQKEVSHAAASTRAMTHVQEQHQRHYGQLTTLSQTLTKRLDKRVLVQAMVETASQITSAGAANSVVSCWLVNLETDTLRFEIGRYCDESLFAQTEFQPTEPPFARVISTQKPLVVPEWKAVIPWIRPEKAAQLNALTGAILVPLMVENSVLGVLIVLCHPDVLKSYEERKSYYEAIWGELALALAIAVQGEVAILDRLTGVHNREYFMRRLIQEMERSTRYKLPMSLLMIDIDNFKAVNDMLGHPQGDAVLRIIARLIKKEVRAIDLVGRYGGEEFIIMLPETGRGDDSTSAAGALAVAERIRAAVDDEFRGLQKPLSLTISVGVAIRRFPEDRTIDHRELLRLADEQLYRAKTTGKNAVCIYTPTATPPAPQQVP